MSDQDPQDNPETQLPQQVSCQLCRKQLPADEAVVEEAKEYVHWFCGQDCYQRWQNEHDQEQESSGESSQKASREASRQEAPRK